MRTVDLLRSLRDGEQIPASELRQFILDLSGGKIPDYQSGAFLMAVYMKGLSQELTVALTLAMRDSGRVIDLKNIPGLKVDKHSTGGVGDKISLPLAPLVAACGVPVPMVSGRGLGHTGGTLDKLESIPGFRVDLPIEKFCQLVAEHGLALIGQTADLAPADKKLYAMRDVTATVESVPLITSSILSKKLAEGIDALVLDVKVGRGAFMKDEASARRLAESLVRVGSGAGLKVRALLTRMEQPLGRMIGNALEIKESIAILKGEGPSDTTELTLALGAEMLVLGGKAKERKEARATLEQAIKSGAALAKFRAIVKAQHGDVACIDDPAKLPAAKQQTPIVAGKGGVVQNIDSYALGILAMRLGAGRATVADKIDAAVGLELLVKTGDNVAGQQPLLLVHHNGPIDAMMPELGRAFAIENKNYEPQPLVLDILE